MRWVILLISTAIAGNALAQAAPPPSIGGKPVTTAGKDTDGKYMVGYEGRGNYLKTRNAIITETKGVPPRDGKQPGDVTKLAKGTMTPAVMPVQAAAPAAMAANNNKLRSDSALRGDGSAARDTAAASAMPAAAAPVVAPPVLQANAAAFNVAGNGTGIKAVTGTPSIGAPVVTTFKTSMPGVTASALPPAPLQTGATSGTIR